MINDFYSHKKLKDEKIVSALRQAAEEYEEGYIAEVKDTLLSICSAITFWEEDWNMA